MVFRNSSAVPSTDRVSLIKVVRALFIDINGFRTDLIAIRTLTLSRTLMKFAETTGHISMS